MHKIGGSIREETYHLILQENAVTSGESLIACNLVFMYDKSKYMAAMCRNYLNDLQQRNTPQLMVWLPLRPAIKPIQSVME